MKLPCMSPSHLTGVHDYTGVSACAICEGNPPCALKTRASAFPNRCRPSRPVCDPEYLNRLAERLSIAAGLSRELARRRVMSMTRRTISAGPDRSYVVRPRRCYCTMTVAPIWTRL